MAITAQTFQKPMDRFQRKNVAIIAYINHYLLLTFSESFVACDLKLGRYRQLTDLMKFYSRSRSFLELDF